MARGALVWLLAPLVAASAKGLKVVEQTFAEIQSDSNQLVVFYHSSEPEGADVIKTIRKAGKRISKVVPQVKYHKCDCDLAINAEECTNAQFTTGVFVFTSTPRDGILKYNGALTPAAIASDVKDKYAEYDDADVQRWTTEDDFWDMMDLSPLDERWRPVFARMQGSGGDRRQRDFSAFNVAATKYRDAAHFVDVVCEQDEETIAFCSRHNFNPSAQDEFALFTGEEVVKLEAGGAGVEPPSATEMRKFIKANAPRFPKEE